MFKKLIIIISLILFCTSCSKSDKTIVSVLNTAESCMEQHPDSSLIILNSINLNEISTKANKARYALLKSIALDKNYIDVTDDSLTSIAVAYYGKHGDADERLKAYLYNGRVYENAKDYERAMSNYLYAEKSVESCKNNNIIGRLYSSKSVLYNTIFDPQPAIEQARLASSYFMKEGDTARFVNQLSNMAVIMNNSSLFDSVSLVEYTRRMEEYWYRLTPSQKDTYFLIQLEQTPKIDTTAIISLINRYLSSDLDEATISWLSVADAYFKIGDYNESYNAIKKHRLKGDNTDATFYAQLSNIYNKKGDYKKAYDLLLKKDSLLYGRYYRATKTDTKFLEERYASKMRDIKQKHMIIFLVMGIIIIALALFLLRKHYLANGLKGLLSLF